MRIDIGCGPNKAPGFIGVDIVDLPGVDIVADLKEDFPFEDNSVDEVRAYDSIEHLPDILHTMNEIWRICKPYGIVDIRVPSTDGRGAFQDPTHVSFWNINSFYYYCIDFPDYFKLSQIYGFKGAFKIISLYHEEYEDKIIQVRARLMALKSSNKNEFNLEEIDIKIHEYHIALLKEQLKLKESNLIIFPDWKQSRNIVLQDLVTALRYALTHPDRNKMTLVIEGSAISREEAEATLSEVVMSLLLEEQLDITEGPEISFLGELNDFQWDTLLPFIQAKILLDHENKALSHRVTVQV